MKTAFDSLLEAVFSSATVFDSEVEMEEAQSLVETASTRRGRRWAGVEPIYDVLSEAPLQYSVF